MKIKGKICPTVRSFNKRVSSFQKRVSSSHISNLRIYSCLACVYRVMDARGKFEEHEKYVRVARGAAESNSSFSSALQTSHP